MTQLAVYDIRDGSYQYEGFGPLREWARQHDIKVEDTYRIEIHYTDQRIARVFTYALDAEGGKYCGRGHDHRLPKVSDEPCEIATREPYDVPCSTPPQEPVDTTTRPKVAVTEASAQA